MLPGQMSTWLLESVQDVPRSLSLKFHHNQVLRYSWYVQMSPEQMLPGQILPGQMSMWLLESVQDVPRNLSLKFHHNQVLRYSWYGQMSRGQKLPGQMLPLQLESVLDVHRNLPLKFHQNRVSNSWDIADIEFLWWVGMHSHFHVKPNHCVEVVLRLGWGFDNIKTSVWQVFKKLW